MEFTIKSIIDAAKQALDVNAERRIERKNMMSRALVEHQDTWAVTDRDNWRGFRDRITAALKTGKPITRKMVGDAPSHFDAELPYYKRREIEEEQRRMKLVDREELGALILALEGMTGDFVTDGQLRNMGFGASSISTVFRAATRAKVGE